MTLILTKQGGEEVFFWLVSVSLQIAFCDLLLGFVSLSKGVCALSDFSDVVQSPFIGLKEAGNNPILYQRYSKLSDILLVSLSPSVLVYGKTTLYAIIKCVQCQTQIKTGPLLQRKYIQFFHWHHNASIWTILPHWVYLIKHSRMTAQSTTLQQPSFQCCPLRCWDYWTNQETFSGMWFPLQPKSLIKLSLPLND